MHSIMAKGGGTCTPSPGSAPGTTTWTCIVPQNQENRNKKYRRGYLYKIPVEILMIQVLINLFGHNHQEDNFWWDHQWDNSWWDCQLVWPDCLATELMLVEYHAKFPETTQYESLRDPSICDQNHIIILLFSGFVNKNFRFTYDSHILK